MTPTSEFPDPKDNDEPSLENSIAAAIDAAANIAERAERLDADLIDEDAIVIQRLRIAQTFDDAEARHQRPEPLFGGPATGACQYFVEGETASEWLTTNYAENLGERR